MSVISGVSVAHDRARVEEIEAAAAPDEVARMTSLRSHGGVREAFALQTCNRAEAYVVTEEPERGRAVLADAITDVRARAVRYMDHEESLRHLLRLAAGLESLVLGEDQIIGQLRDAYERARGVGALGDTLEDALTKAIHVGERARSETGINEGVVSLGSAAVTLAERERDLAGATALVVGAGEMGTIAARAFADAGVARVIVANRTIPHAEHVARELPVEASAVGLDVLGSVAPAADVLVSATGSPDPVVGTAALADAGETFVIDIAQPRDVSRAAAALEHVTVRDLDSLEDVTERTREQRREAAAAVSAIVDEEFAHLQEQYKRRRADDVIAAMYEGAEVVKARELRRALSQLEAAGHVTDDQRAVVESLADALVSQLLAPPTRSLREAAAEDDWTTINTALQLFDPDFRPDGLELPDGVELPESVEQPGAATGATEED